MNKTVTSEEEVLKASRKIISEKGLSFLSMRAVAAECGISVGSVYNYFPSKTELIRLTVESVWKEIFRPLEEQEDGISQKMFESSIRQVMSYYMGFERNE